MKKKPRRHRFHRYRNSRIFKSSFNHSLSHDAQRNVSNYDPDCAESSTILRSKYDIKVSL